MDHDQTQPAAPQLADIARTLFQGDHPGQRLEEQPITIVAQWVARAHATINR